MISYSIITNQGDRDYNEDNVRVIKENKNFIFAIADGLGGQGNGDVASGIAVNSLEFPYNQKPLEKKVAQNFDTAQKNIMDKKIQDSRLKNMMTTLVMLQLENDEMIWGHVGDSRLYYFEEKKLISHTLDHSVPQILCQTGQIDESEIRHHPDRNRLLRSMGSEWDKALYQLSTLQKLRGKQEFLLCSDGFWEYIEDEEIEAELQHSISTKQWLRKMEQIVKRKGAGENMDNYSAIAVWSK
jgi:serine/threonine protein phosphatase PrpC